MALPTERREGLLMHEFRIVHVTHHTCPELNEAAKEGFYFHEWVPSQSGELRALLCRVDEEARIERVETQIEAMVEKVVGICKRFGIPLPWETAQPPSWDAAPLPTDRPPAPGPEVNGAPPASAESTGVPVELA